MSELPPLNRRGLSRALSHAANASAGEILRMPPLNALRQARRIGITGPPGAGKSTLIGRLVRRRLENGHRLAVIAIDPSSPGSRGSILGDRLRMDEQFDHPNLFIRSFPSRSAHDGLTDNLPEILDTLDSFGFDEVIIETVGVGQAEYGIRAFVDTEVLVLVPEAGDQVQAMKSGILETADLYVVNKSDLEGAGKIAAAIRGVLQFGQHDRKETPVLMVSERDEKSVDELNASIQERLGRAIAGRDQNATRRLRQRVRIENLIRRQLADLLSAVEPATFDSSLEDIHQEVIKRLAHKTT